MDPKNSIIIYVITFISLTGIMTMAYPVSEPISTPVPTVIFHCFFVCPPNTSYNCCPNPKPLCGCCSCNPMPVHCKCKAKPLCCYGPPNPKQCHCGCAYSKECDNIKPPYYTQTYGIPPLPVLCLCAEFNGTKPCCTKPQIPGQCVCDCIYSKKCNNLYLTAEPPYKPGKPSICDCTLIDPPQGPQPCCTYKPGVCECGCQQCNNYPWYGWNGWHRDEKQEPRKLIG